MDLDLELDLDVDLYRYRRYRYIVNASYKYARLQQGLLFGGSLIVLS